MERGDKEKEVALLTEQFGNCAVALCADYRGLTVEQMTILRQNLNEKGSFGKQLSEANVMMGDVNEECKKIILFLMELQHKEIQDLRL